MEKERVIRRESNGIWMNPKTGDSTTTRMESQQTLTSNQNRSLTLTDKLITGIIAIALMCIAPIIPILIAFGAGHFLNYNANKLRNEKNHERTNTRRYQ